MGRSAALYLPLKQTSNFSRMPIDRVLLNSHRSNNVNPSQQTSSQTLSAHNTVANIPANTALCSRNTPNTNFSQNHLKALNSAANSSTASKAPKQIEGLGSCSKTAVAVSNGGARQAAKFGQNEGSARTQFCTKFNAAKAAALSQRKK